MILLRIGHHNHRKIVRITVEFPSAEVELQDLRDLTMDIDEADRGICS